MKTTISELLDMVDYNDGTVLPRDTEVFTKDEVDKIFTTRQMNKQEKEIKAQIDEYLNKMYDDDFDEEGLYLDVDDYEVIADMLDRLEKIELTLKDQYPIASDKDIDVKIIEINPDVKINNSETGIVTWETKLSAGETKTFVISYSVKYPKEKNLYL